MRERRCFRDRLGATRSVTVRSMADLVLRTPDARFASLPDFPWNPRYIDCGGVRVACIDEGPRDAAPVLLLHGEPSWSFLYRKMIPEIGRAHV